MTSGPRSGGKKSGYGYGGYFIVLDLGDGESQHSSIGDEWDRSLGLKKLNGFDAYA